MVALCQLERDRQLDPGPIQQSRNHLILMLFGMVMVYSASIALPDSPKFAYLQGRHEYFLFRQMAFIVAAIAAAWVTFRIPIATLQKMAPMMFVGTLVLLMLVL